MTDSTKNRWKTIFADFDSSGLSAVEYCRLKKINLQVFYNVSVESNPSSSKASRCSELK